MHIYICTYELTFIQVHHTLYIYMYMYIYMYIYMHMHVYVYVQIHKHTELGAAPVAQRRRDFGQLLETEKQHIHIHIYTHTSPCTRS